MKNTITLLLVIKLGDYGYSYHLKKIEAVWVANKVSNLSCPVTGEETKAQKFENTTIMLYELKVLYHIRLLYFYT
jgi:hypothetical protein